MFYITYTYDTYFPVLPFGTVYTVCTYRNKTLINLSKPSKIFAWITEISSVYLHVQTRPNKIQVASTIRVISRARYESSFLRKYNKYVCTSVRPSQSI